MTDIIKKYTNGEVTIVWKPDTCIHSTICWKKATGLPDVFNPFRKPWIMMDQATTSEMVEQVKKCPSGALSYYMNNETVDTVSPAINAESIVEPVPNGPLLVYGNITIKEPDGTEVKKNKVTAFCRCGGSGNKPYCDGTHTKNGFTG